MYRIDKGVPINRGRLRRRLGCDTMDALLDLFPVRGLFLSLMQVQCCAV